MFIYLFIFGLDLFYCSVDFDVIGFRSPYKPLSAGQTSSKLGAIRNRMKTAQNKAEQDTITIAMLEGEKDASCSINQEVLRGNRKYTLISPKPVLPGQLLLFPFFFWFPGNTF